MLYELFITHCTYGTLIMNRFTYLTPECHVGDQVLDIIQEMYGIQRMMLLII